jgi:hypothetical protein
MPEIARWGVIDRQTEKLPWLTPYRYAFNNPMRFADPNGETEEERTKAVAFARSLRGQAYNSSISGLGYSISGYEALDCSNLVRLSINQSTELGDLSSGKSGKSGVENLLEGGSYRNVGIDDIRDGDAVVMKIGDNINGHTGFVTDVVKDENGKVISYKILHAEAAWVTKDKDGNVLYSGGGKVNDDFTVVVGKEKHYGKSKYQHRFYQWDTPDNDGKTSGQDSGASNNGQKNGEGDDKNKSGMTWGQFFGFVQNLLSVNPNIPITIR